MDDLEGRRERAECSRAGAGPIRRRAGAAAEQRVRRAATLPAGGEHDVRILGMNGHIDHAGLVAHELHQLPRRAAVGGLVQATLRIRAPRRTERRHVHDVRVGRVHRDATDVLGLLESLGRPGDAAVGGLENAAARLDGIARIRLTGAGPHLLRIRRRDGEHAHRNHALVVEHRAPRGAVVGGLPDATAGGGGEQGLGGARNADHVGHAAHEVGGANRTPAHTGHGGGVERLRTQRGSAQ